jgi:hypothetical protein
MLSKETEFPLHPHCSYVVQSSLLSAAPLANVYECVTLGSFVKPDQASRSRKGLSKAQ